MGRRDAFSGYHPGVNALYFALVLVFTMGLTHPAGLVISLGSALCYQERLLGRGSAARQGRYMLPTMAMAALLNPLFNHRGATVLAQLPGGSPLTLESVLCGVGGAVTLWAVVAWFGCYNAVMTSDRFVYLFGRIIPALSLVLSMTLRFVPRFKDRLRTVMEGQRGLGRSVTEGRALARLRNATAMVSILLTWSLEDAIETADSMRGRGYGLTGRTAFSIYRLDGRDRLCLVWLVSVGFFLACAWRAGGLAWRYFPTVESVAASPMTVSFWAGYLALCLTPVILDGKEAAAWRCLRSTV